MSTKNKIPTIHMKDGEFSPVFRVNFEKVLEPEVDLKTGEKVYSLCAMFPKTTDLTLLKSMAKEAVIGVFGSVEAASTPFTSPFSDGDVKYAKVLEECNASKGTEAEADKLKKLAYYECFRGHIYLNSKSRFEVKVVSSDGKQTITDKASWYSGCYARAKLSATWYDYLGKRGVKFYLGHVHKVKDGEKLFSTAPSATSVFSAVAAPQGAASDIF